jgi:hypothetical protein
MHLGDEKCIQNFSSKPERERPLWRHKLDLGVVLFDEPKCVRHHSLHDANKSINPKPCVLFRSVTEQGAESFITQCKTPSSEDFRFYLLLFPANPLFDTSTFPQYVHILKTMFFPRLIYDRHCSHALGMFTSSVMSANHAGSVAGQSHQCSLVSSHLQLSEESKWNYEPNNEKKANGNTGFVNQRIPNRRHFTEYINVDSWGIAVFVECVKMWQDRFRFPDITHKEIDRFWTDIVSSLS